MASLHADVLKSERWGHEMGRPSSGLAGESLEDRGGAWKRAMRGLLDALYLTRLPLRNEHTMRLSD